MFGMHIYKKSYTGRFFLAFKTDFAQYGAKNLHSFQYLLTNFAKIIENSSVWGFTVSS